MSGAPHAGAVERGAEVLEALATRPGGRELLGLGRTRADAALVGGAVRDLLLRREPRELDVIVDSEAAGFARTLQEHLPHDRGEAPRLTLHERFGTALVEWPGGRIDIAERRAESYPRPGALPEVRPGDAEQDLARRDFTVNALAVALGGARRGEVQAAAHAIEDLDAGTLRVLHRDSFIDDPTRLLRLARYSVRLGFEAEPHTSALAERAVAEGALRTVSGARLGAELRLAAREPNAPRTLARLGELGLLAALGLPASFDAALASRALELLPQDGSRELALIAVLFRPPGGADAAARSGAARLMDDFDFTAHERERALAGAFDAAALADAVQRTTRPSQLHELLAGVPVEALAIAGARAEGPDAVADRIRAWLSELRHVKLEIGGADLLAAGVPQSQEIGRRLERVLAMKLDGELRGGREEELKAALEAST